MNVCDDCLYLRKSCFYIIYEKRGAYLFWRQIKKDEARKRVINACIFILQTLERTDLLKLSPNNIKTDKTENQFKIYSVRIFDNI